MNVYNLKIVLKYWKRLFYPKAEFIKFSKKKPISFIKPSNVVLICWLICWLLTCKISRTISKRNFLVYLWGVIFVRLCTGCALKGCLDSVHWVRKTHFKGRWHHFLSLGLGLHAKGESNLLHHSSCSASWLWMQVMSCLELLLPWIPRHSVL